MSPRALPIAALAALLALTGCGDPDLWARWRAEREFWRASREVSRLELQPRLATPADWSRAARRFGRVAESFPATTWATSEALRRGRARDVALLSGRAAIAAARMRESGGDLDSALAGYRDAAGAYAGLWIVSLEALVGYAAALERAGRLRESAAVYEDIAARFGPLDPESGAAVAAALEAPLRAADLLEAAGARDRADLALRAGERRLAAAFLATRGLPSRAAIAPPLARLRVRSGRTDAALAALREALPETQAAGGRAALARTLLALAGHAIDGGRPDSAFAYARWAAGAFEGRARAEAMILESRAWESVGPPDSALAAWTRFLDLHPRTVEGSTRARFRRARILEDMGRWGSARGEYRALIAADPAHELTFAALRRIVDWHAGRGEKELARIEAARGLESLDALIAGHRDDTVLQRARRTRAELLLATEDWQPACSALSDLWNRYGDGGSGLRAAGVAESRLGDPGRARALYRDLADRAPGEEERRSARNALARLESRGQG